MSGKISVKWKKMSQAEFTKTLVSINEALGASEETLQALIFLCRDVCPDDAKAFDQPLRLFNELLDRRQINHHSVDFLAELMWRIGRKDLVKKYFVEDLTSYPTYIKRHPCFSQYRVLLHELCEGIVDKTLHLMKEIDPVKDTIGKQKLSKISTPQALFTKMEEENLLWEGNLDNVIKMVNMIEDDHLYDILVKHKKVEPKRRRMQHESHNTRPGGNDMYYDGQPPNGFHRPPNVTMDNNYFAHMHCEAGQGALRREMDHMHIVPNKKDRLAHYNMTNRPRGHCIIINNVLFNKDHTIATARTMKHRDGAEQDIELLRETWQNLGFIVTVYRDLTSKQMERVMYEMGRKTDHTPFDAFVCCILSHGATSQVYGCDGVPLNVKEIVNYVKPATCKSLVGKPKLFFFQACQGGDRQEGYAAETIETDHISIDAPSMLDIPPELPYVPNEADIMISYATVAGFVSYRSKTSGSFYITKLCECLDEYAGPDYDLLTILTEVNRRVSDMTVDNSKTGTGYKQVPQPQTTLRKQVFFD